MENDKELLKNTFPSNSKFIQKEKVEEENHPKVNKIIKGNIKIRKQSFGKKVMQTFLEDSTKSVGSYIFHDVLLPAAKNLICDIIGWGGFAEILLFGDKRSRRDGGIRSGRQTPYGSFFRSLDRDARDPRERTISRQNRVRHDFNEIIFETRGEAEDVLFQMNELLKDYKQVTVADFYDLVGIQPTYIDRRHGWTDLRSCYPPVRLRGGGYIIDFPRTEQLE